MSPRIPSSSRSAFTLIESLAVILILGLIISIATPTMLSAIRASRLTSAGELITGKLVEAQGLALTFSSDVELRLYKSPVNKPADGTSGQYLQLLQWVEKDPDEATEEGDVASLKKIGPAELLPDGVAISDNPDFSSLWTLTPQQETTQEGDREYVAIRFRPDGSTDLAETDPWHLTLVEQREIAHTDLPGNFYTVQIDPVTARLEIYRPE